MDVPDVRDIEDLGDYNWGKAVIDYLMSYVDSNDPQDVKG